MVSNSIVAEIELNKAEIEKISVADSDRFEEILNTLLDLATLCNNEKDYATGYEVAEFARVRAKELCEHCSGMSMRELNDIVIAEPDFYDTKYELYWNLVLEECFYNFESFMWFMEKNRYFEKKFYEPRMKTKQGKETLRTVAKELQAFEFGKYKKLAISQPPRTGKSTIFMFYLTWHALRRPNSHNAYGGYSGVLANGFYKEIMNLISGEEYTFSEIYSRYHPARTIIHDKSAENLTVNLDESDRFSTITCRGIDGSWTGIIDISEDGILAVDDLVRDREESMSPTRMEKLFQEYLNKMVDRMNVGSHECLIGTLWSVADPIERLRKMYEGRPDCKFLRIPALDENDESNFDYEVKGFDSEYYREMRERLDPAEWCAKYQQKPFVREGLLFPTEQLRYFDGLVRIDDIKSVYSVCDPAFGGHDKLSMPICYELNNGRRLICGWVYDNRTIAYTIPRVVRAMAQHGISEMRLEKNGAGLLLEENVRKEMAKQSVFGCKVFAVSAPNKTSKEDKIKGYSDYIISNFEFLLPNLTKPEDLPDDMLFFSRDADYQTAFDDFTFYTTEGKNPYDDAADSMAQLAIRCEKSTKAQIKVIHNPFGEGRFL